MTSSARSVRPGYIAVKVALPVDETMATPVPTDALPFATAYLTGAVPFLCSHRARQRCSFPPLQPHTYDHMTAIPGHKNQSRIPGHKNQSRSSLGQWGPKSQSAPETGALIRRIPAEGDAERLFRARRERALIRSEMAFLYSTLGDVGSDVFDALGRIGELATAEGLLNTAFSGLGPDDA